MTQQPTPDSARPPLHVFSVPKKLSEMSYAEKVAWISQLHKQMVAQLTESDSQAETQSEIQTESHTEIKRSTLKPLALIYSDVYLDWMLGSGNGDHPTNPVRAKLATELLVRNLGDNARVIDPVASGFEDRDLEALNNTHESSYVRQTLSGTNHEWSGCKVQVANAGFAMFRGTIRAVEELLAGRSRVAFNPQGAKHHARFASGSGFCVFNDMAYAAKALQAAGLRPLYIDWDIHAGDGVMHMLEGSNIPCISIHASDIYPMDHTMQTLGPRGEAHNADAHQYNFNVQRGDGDEQFKQYIDAAAEIIDRYKPDVILVAAGADGHTGVGNLGAIANYTKDGFRYAAEMVAEKAIAYSQGRVLIGGAGGYQPLVETPQTWALVVETIYNSVETELTKGR